MSTRVEGLARSVAVGLFEQHGKHNPIFDVERAERKRTASRGNTKPVWSTALVGAWFLRQSRGVPQEAAKSLKRGHAVASEISLCREPFVGDTAKVVGKFLDTFGRTPRHPKPAYYRIYNLNPVPVGEYVARMTSDWVVWVFVRTGEGWKVFVFALPQETSDLPNAQ